MCGVVFNLLLAGEQLGGGVCRDPDRQELTFPPPLWIFFLPSQPLGFFSDLPFILSPSTPPSSSGPPSSHCFLHFLLAAVRLYPSAFIFYSLYHSFIPFPLLCCHLSLSICPVSFSINHLCEHDLLSLQSNLLVYLLFIIPLLSSLFPLLKTILKIKQMHLKKIKIYLLVILKKRNVGGSGHRHLGSAE